MDTIIEQRISHSTKIGKQVLISQYAKEALAANMAINVAEEKVIGGRIWCVNTLDAEITATAKKVFLSTPVGKIAEMYADIKSVDLLDIDVNDDQNSFCVHTSMLMLLDPRDSSHRYNLGASDSFLKEVIRSCVIDVLVEVQIGYNDSSAKETQSFVYGVMTPVELTKSQVNRLELMLSDYTELIDERTKYDGVQTKIREIDSHMEKLEAELLMRELNSTDEGKAVLQLTEDILTSVGSSLPVLESK